MPSQTNALTPALFLGIFILAFFPNIFIQLLSLPLVIPVWLFTASPASTVTPTPGPQHHLDPAVLSSRIANLEQRTDAAVAAMSWSQKQFTLASRSRGAYLVTDEVLKQVPEIKEYKVGLLNLFVQHTSCALSLNENWDSEVR